MALMSFKFHPETQGTSQPTLLHMQNRLLSKVRTFGLLLPSFTILCSSCVPGFLSDDATVQPGNKEKKGDWREGYLVAAISKPREWPL